MSTNALKFKDFRYGNKPYKYSDRTPQFNHPATDRWHNSWLGDDEFVGRDKLSVSRDLHVATGVAQRGSFYE